MKEEARRKHAVAVIWAYWLGLKVLSQTLLSVNMNSIKRGILLTLNKQAVMWAH